MGRGYLVAGAGSIRGNDRAFVAVTGSYVALTERSPRTPSNSHLIHSSIWQVCNNVTATK